MGKRQVLGAVGLGGAALTLAGASMVWACSGGGYVDTAPPGAPSTTGINSTSSGPPGSSVTVNGRAFQQGPVQIRWNSTTGDLMGNAVGPSFSVSVKVPAKAQEGVNYIVAVQNLQSSNTAYTVTSPGSTGTSTQGAYGQNLRDAQRQGSGVSGDASGAYGGLAPAPSGKTSGAQNGNGGSRGNAGAGNVGNAGSGVASGVAGPGASFASGVNGANPPGGVAGANGPQGAAALNGGGSTGSIRAVAGNLWSGFSSGRTQDVSLPTGQADGQTPTAAIGVAVLGGGMIALASGFAVAEAARRRKVAVLAG